VKLELPARVVENDHEALEEGNAENSANGMAEGRLHRIEIHARDGCLRQRDAG
jgi:hypothetical protein